MILFAVFTFIVESFRTSRAIFFNLKERSVFIEKCGDLARDNADLTIHDDFIMQYGVSSYPKLNRVEFMPIILNTTLLQSALLARCKASLGAAPITVYSAPAIPKKGAKKRNKIQQPIPFFIPPNFIFPNQYIATPPLHPYVVPTLQQSHAFNPDAPVFVPRWVSSQGPPT